MIGLMTKSWLQASSHASTIRHLRIFGGCVTDGKKKSSARKKTDDAGASRPFRTAAPRGRYDMVLDGTGPQQMLDQTTVQLGASRLYNSLDLRKTRLCSREAMTSRPSCSTKTSRKGTSMRVCFTRPRLTMQSRLARKNAEESKLCSHSRSGRRIRGVASLKCTRVYFPQASRVEISEARTTKHFALSAKKTKSFACDMRPLWSADGELFLIERWRCQIGELRSPAGRGRGQPNRIIVPARILAS